MKDRKSNDPIPPELSPENDEYVDDAVQLAQKQLSPTREREVRDRMARDPVYRAVVEQVVDSYAAPELSEREFSEKFAEFRELAGLTDAEVNPGLEDYKARVRSRSRWLVLKLAAAAIIVVVGAPWVVERLVEWRYYTTRTAEADEYRLVQLGEGSTVYLSPGSSARYDRETALHDEREVSVEGEATFNVTPNPRASFLVHTRLAHIVVVGTRFVVHANRGMTEVRVDEGRLSVELYDRKRNLTGIKRTIGAGESVRVTAAGIFDTPHPPPPPPSSTPAGARP
jgi:ferric-dicitrate binding protein FerR (iron transport regulator)